MRCEVARWGFPACARPALLIVAALAIVACDSPDPVAPRAVGISQVRATGVLIASGSGLIQAAAPRSDSSAGAIFVARVEARGQAGDSIVLGMFDDPRTIQQLASGSQFIVKADDAEDRIAAREAINGVSILRLGDQSPTTFEVWLARGTTTKLATPAFELRLGGSAHLSVVQAGWLGAARTSSRTARVADPSSCDIDGPTGTCGGVSWTVLPHYPPTPFCGTTCFRSTPNTGQSLPIEIVFSQPVASVTATIMDPTWDGNTISAIAFDGSTIDTKTFAYSGEPHVNIPDTKSVAGVIDRILLQPTDNEYVAYVVTFVPLEARIAVSCTAVTRGQSATCTATPTAPGSSLVPSAWQFRDADGNSVDRTESVDSDSWIGTAVKSGTVRVNGTVDGVAAFGVATLTVAARSWTGKLAPKAHSVIASALPAAPTMMKELGDAELSLPIDGDFGTWLRSIEDQGPNHGFFYAVEIPVVATTTTQVNTNAINATSPFYFAQETRRKKIGGIWFCPRSLVTGALHGLVRDHEGATADPTSLPNSHAQIYRSHVDALAYLRFESVVGFGGENAVTPVSAPLHMAASADSEAMDSDSRNNITNVSLGCDTFRFTY